MTRVKGFAPWKPQKRTEPLLKDIERVLVEYRQYLPLTVRQVFYRLVGKGYEKSENFYETVQDKCNRARRCGRISFQSIRDDGVSRMPVKPHTPATKARRSTTRTTTNCTTSTSARFTRTSPLSSWCCARPPGWSP